MASHLEGLAKLVKVARVRKPLTQKQLAAQIGTSPATISAVEHELRDIQIGTLIRILDALEIDYDIGGEIVSQRLKEQRERENEDIEVILRRMLENRKAG